MKRFETRDEQPMKMGSNKAFEAIGAKARLSLNANVGIRKMGYSTTNGPSTTVNGKSIDHAATIQDGARA